MTRSADVIVIGGGVIGCAVAYELARDGCDVLLLERDEIGAHASGVAAGMLAPLAEAHGDAPIPLGLESLARFPALAAELRERSGVDPHVVASGVLRVATTEAEAADLRARAARFAAHGTAWLDAAEARAHEPGLAAEGLGALFSPHEGHVEAALLTTAFALAARALGARLSGGEPVIGLVRRGDRITGVRTTSGERGAAHVVLATGPWAGADAAALGLAAAPPVEPVRGQILALRPRARLASIAWSDRVYLVPRHDGRLLAGATVERAGFDRRITASGVGALLAGAVALVPALADAGFEGAAAGLRPGTPDGLPIVGPAPSAEGLVLAVGHGRNGILLAPATGRLVADLVAGKPLPEAARAFAPGRFAADAAERRPRA